jgi:hypothetical protein
MGNMMMMKIIGAFEVHAINYCLGPILIVQHSHPGAAASTGLAFVCQIVITELIQTITAASSLLVQRISNSHVALVCCCWA